MRHLLSRRLVAVLGALLLGEIFVPAEGLAQSRPYRGLFRSENSNPNSAQALTIGASIYGGYDDNATAQQGTGSNDPRTQVGSVFGGGDVSVNYNRQLGRRAALSAGVSTATRYYPDLNDLSGGSYRGSVGLNFALGRRTQLNLSQGLGYSPFYAIGMFPTIDAPDPSDPIASDLNLTLIKQPSWQNDSSIALVRQLGRRSTFTAFYDRSQSNFTQTLIPTVEAPDPDVPLDPDAPPVPPPPPEPEAVSLDFITQGGGFRFTRRLTRNATLRLGYTYRQSDYETGTDQNLKSHDIDVGVDYARSLSLSRRATLSFGSGSSVITTGDRTFARVNGNVNLSVALARAWDFGLAYDRGLAYVNGLSAPVFSDSASARLQGTLSRRLTMSGGVAYSTGEQAVVADQDRFSTYTASVGTQFALNRFMAAEAEYYYYYYDFAGNALSPLGVVSQLGRHGVRGGLTFWFPVLR